MLRKVLCSITILIICTSQSFAFDGVRKGFAMGIGLGYAPYANPNITNFDNDYSFKGVGMNLIVGYNWNHKNLLAWEILGAVNASENSKDDEGFIGINGVTWYHYFDPTPKSFYTIAGMGRLISFPMTNDYSYTTTGLGFVLGGGYEFTKQVQLSVYYLGGKTSDHNIKVNNNMIMTIISVVAY